MAPSQVATQLINIGADSTVKSHYFRRMVYMYMRKLLNKNANMAYALYQYQ